MLFDLRARGRRRTVQFVYLGLAVLMGGGLILFGIGGATSGGLLDAFNGSGGSSSGANIYQQRAERDLALAQKHPNDPARWSQLARDQYYVATSGNGYDSQTGTFTAQAVPALRKASAAWQHYLSLNPPHPDADVAALMARAYAGGLNDLPKAVEAWQLYTQAHPSGPVYTQLARLAYAAGQTRTGDLAAAKAIALTPKAQRAFVRTQLQQIKAQAARQAASPGAAGASPATPTHP